MIFIALLDKIHTNPMNIIILGVRIHHSMYIEKISKIKNLKMQHFKG